MRQNTQKMNQSIKIKADFYSKWEKQRLRKWQYILFRGIVYWGLPLGTLIYFMWIKFSFTSFNLSDYIERLLVISLVACLSEYNEYNRREKIYQNKDEELKD